MLEEIPKLYIETTSVKARGLVLDYKAKLLVYTHQQGFKCGRDTDIGKLETAVSLYETLLNTSLELKLIQSINLMIVKTCLDFHSGQLGIESKEVLNNVSSYWNSYFERKPEHLSTILRYLSDVIQNKRAERHKIHLPLGSAETCGVGISEYYKLYPEHFSHLCTVTRFCNNF